MPVKFILTTLTLGAGFQGGEVTPLFDIGASFGGWYANLFGIEPSFLAAIGLICVFGSAANTPITTIMLGIELFGAEAAPYFVYASLISFKASGKSGNYSSQERKHSKCLFSAKADFSEKIWYNIKRNNRRCCMKILVVFTGGTIGSCYNDGVISPDSNTR